MYKTLHISTNTFPFNTNKLPSIKVIKKTHLYRHKVIKNAKFIKAWIKLKLFVKAHLHVRFQRLIWH